MRLVIIVSCIMSLVLTMSSCEKDTNAPPKTTTFSITGKIIHGESGLPGIPITLEGNEANVTITTLLEGEYTFTNITQGTYTVTPSDSGYIFIPQSLNATITNSDITLSDIYAFDKVTFLPITLQGVLFLPVSPGAFEMGSSDGMENEQPLHDVILDGFYMSATEITQSQYVEIMANNPSFHRREMNPVEQVSWEDAVRFCNALSMIEGLQPSYDEATWESDFSSGGFRLPTEAEWEYACRAGTQSAFSSGDSEDALSLVCWYNENSSGEPHPVGLKEPNEWGFFDMHGNVWEWCHDRYSPLFYSVSTQRNPTGPTDGTIRVKRGGSWFSGSDNCRSSFRGFSAQNTILNRNGFRVVKKL